MIKGQQNLDLALQIFDHACKCHLGFSHNYDTYHIMIECLSKKGNIWEAKKLFDEFEKGSIPSVLPYNTLINGMCERGELQEAGRLWDDMVEKGIVPYVFTYNMLITGFCKAGKASDGLRILEEMLEKECMPNKDTYSILVEGLYCSGKKEEVMKVLIIAITSRGVLVDLESWVVFVTKVAGGSESWQIILDGVLSESETAI